MLHISHDVGDVLFTLRALKRQSPTSPVENTTIDSLGSTVYVCVCVCMCVWCISQRHTREIASLKHCRLYKQLALYAVSTFHFRPHRSTTYVYAAYCYQPSSVVCRSVCRSATLVSPTKTAEPIELPFRLWAPVSPGNHVGPDPPWEGTILRGEGTPIVKYMDFLP